ncbi:uncharacterized protein [Diadema antillarum]|uniref:uncharacterized protein n=1 Tax=Diadema antillarum TaxID=105358 RepID=UPI003A8BA34C
MWGRMSNLVQNVQGRLDTVVDNVNKSVSEEEDAGRGTKQGSVSMDTSTMSPGDASFVSAGDSSFTSASDAQEQLAEQSRLLSQLKDMIRQKDKELVESTAKLSKFKLQAKAKIATLTNQLEEAKKGGKGKTGDDKEGASDDASSRGKLLVLKKKLDEKEKVLAESESKLSKLEEIVNEKQAMLNQRDDRIKVCEQRIEELEEQDRRTTGELLEKEKIIEKRDAMLEALRSGGAAVVMDTGPTTQLNNRVKELEKLLREEKTKSQEVLDHLVRKDQLLIEQSDRVALLEYQTQGAKQMSRDQDEVIEGRDRAIKVLQEEGSKKDQEIGDLNRVIENMRSKMESSDERITQLADELEAKTALLRQERERFNQEKAVMEEKLQVYEGAEKGERETQLQEQIKV